jgi:predicted ester cyclase
VFIRAALMRFEFVSPLPKSNSQPTREIISGVKEGPMSEANKALIRRVIEELFNKHNAALIDELYPDCVYRAPAVGELRGEAYKQFLTSVLAGFPDGRWTVEDQVAEGDKVVTRWSFTGIHRGNVMGIAPTGKQVTTSGVMIDRIIGGKIAEEWEEYDSLGMMQQLDAEPAIAKDKAAA